MVMNQAAAERDGLKVSGHQRWVPEEPVYVDRPVYGRGVYRPGARTYDGELIGSDNRDPNIGAQLRHIGKDALREALLRAVTGN